jgi:hypothetical protein
MRRWSGHHRGLGRFEAPDLIEPIEGWRCWRIEWEPDGAANRVLVLRSPVFGRLWPPRAALLADCESEEDRSAEHAAPEASCRCGIYASVELGKPLSHVPFDRRDFDRGGSLIPLQVGWLLGRVALWGRVVECQEGWRGQCAYPTGLRLPLGLSLKPAGAEAPVRSEELAQLLEDCYRVPCKLVATLAAPTQKTAS